MSSGRRSPLLSFTLTEMLNSTAQSTNSSNNAILPDDPDASRKRWYHYLPLCGTIFLILLPQPSWLWILVDFHLQTLHRPGLFIIHLLVSYTLIFMIFSSLLVCLIRDPGPSTVPSTSESVTGEGEDIGLRAALLSDDDDFTSPNKWCRKCWAPKPERAHHCSICGRCVLKMDHHCPWLGAKCIGHRTYPAFIHFLGAISLLAAYFALVCGHALWYSFNHPFDSGAYTPVHELALTFYGSTFALCIGSFAGYHLYLTSTNQTTIENITPFLLLRHLPRLPRNGHSLSDPPLEPELSFPQRRLVKGAHNQLSLYDIGFRKNWAQTFGWRTKRELLYRLWWGGASPGDGKIFPKNPRSEEVLAKLAKGLANLDIDR